MEFRCGHAPLLFEGAALLGRSLYLVKLSRVKCELWQGDLAWRKRRRCYAPLIVVVGNALSRFCNCGVYGLPHSAWLDWEERLSALFGDGGTGRSGRALIAQPLPGVSLREVLPEANLWSEALHVALLELRRLHGTKVRFPSGQQDQWSHGDAHAGNVFFDAATGRAHWFDFESVHDLRNCPSQRHADDLRALLFSAAVNLPETYWPAMVELAREVYDEDTVWRELYGTVLRLERWPNVIHLGHAHLKRKAHTRFLELLRIVCG
jgi:hypothetical protein